MNMENEADVYGAYSVDPGTYIGHERHSAIVRDKRATNGHWEDGGSRSRVYFCCS